MPQSRVDLSGFVADARPVAIRQFNLLGGVGQLELVRPVYKSDEHPMIRKLTKDLEELCLNLARFAGLEGVELHFDTGRAELFKLIETHVSPHLQVLQLLMKSTQTGAPFGRVTLNFEGFIRRLQRRYRRSLAYLLGRREQVNRAVKTIDSRDGLLLGDGFFRLHRRKVHHAESPKRIEQAVALGALGDDVHFGHLCNHLGYSCAAVAAGSSSGPEIGASVSASLAFAIFALPTAAVISSPR